jgi:hypothetical protein
MNVFIIFFCSLNTRKKSQLDFFFPRIILGF